MVKLVTIGAVVAAIARPAAAASDAPRPPSLGPWGFDAAGMDRAVRPGDDFNRYVSGRYLDRLQIPADQSSWGETSVSGQAVQDELRLIVEGAAAGAGPQDRDTARIGALYGSFMDEARLEQLDAGPIAPELAAIRAVRTPQDMARVMGRSTGGLGTSFVRIGVGDDERNPGRIALSLRQGGLGLPDRSTYLEPQFAALRAGYQAYIRTLLTDVGWPDAAASAQAVYDLEHRVAEAHWSRQEERDPTKTYTPIDRADLPKLAPGFPWTAFFQGAGLASRGRIVEREAAAVPKLAQVFATTPLATLKAWEAFHVTDEAAPYLSRRFVEARFEFRQKQLEGQPELAPRWKRGVELVDSTLGEPLARVFVRRWFSPQAKAQAQALVGEIVAAMRRRIAAADWMSPATRSEALAKIAKLKWQVGYPDRWRDDSGLVMRRGDLLGDVERADAFEWTYERSRIGRPIDPDEWFFMPQVGQAYYSPSRNEVVVAAAVLQPPNFDPAADAAVNYGAIGAIVGHEITHGFDDQGRRYDGDGRLRDWWAPEDEQRFKARAEALARQYDAIEVLPGAHVNGELSLGENIADLGGVLLALDAYHASLKGRPAPVIDGFTGDQRVFLGWAQKWRRKFREPLLRSLLAADPHAPNDVRAAAPLRNVDAWYQAFDVKPGERMYLPPGERVRIW
jgi:putative endopeptidase